MRKLVPLVLLTVGLLGVAASALLMQRQRAASRPGGAGDLRQVVLKGQRAHAFSMEKLQGGGEVTLSSYQGKVLMLDFWATWCPPCVEEIPTLVKLAKEYEGRGVAFLAANRDDPETWRADVGLFAERSAPALPGYVAYAGDATTEAYGLSVLPTLVFIGPAGELLGSYEGWADERELRARIERARAAVR